jgi:hypothetical protein
MKLFVIMKPWQLFILLILSFSVSSLFTIVYFVWMLSISIYIKNKLPARLRILAIIFRFLIGIAILLFIFKTAYLYYLSLIFNPNVDDRMAIFNMLLEKEFIMGYFILPVLYIVFSLIIAKLFKAAEDNKNVKFSEYAGDFFMFLFSAIGLWILQPRINKLTSNPEGALPTGNLS